MRLALRLLVLLPLALAGPLAGASEPAQNPEVVRITGLRAIPWKSYRALRAAMDAYAAHKGLAPDAVFKLGVVLPPGATLPPNFAMRVSTPDGKEYPITMNGKLFELPILPEDVLDADLVTNLKGTAVKIGIHMETPGVPIGMDRLGDLRLSCRIERAIDRVEDGLLARMLRPDVCDTPKGAYWTYAHFGVPSSGAALVDSARRQALERRTDAHGIRYRIPLYDTGWGNDTLVEYAYTKLLPAATSGRTLRFTLKD